MFTDQGKCKQLKQHYRSRHPLQPLLNPSSNKILPHDIRNVGPSTSTERSKGEREDIRKKKKKKKEPHHSKESKVNENRNQSNNNTVKVLTGKDKINLILNASQKSIFEEEKELEYQQQIKKEILLKKGLQYLNQAKSSTNNYYSSPKSKYNFDWENSKKLNLDKSDYDHEEDILELHNLNVNETNKSSVPFITDNDIYLQTVDKIIKSGVGNQKTYKLRHIDQTIKINSDFCIENPRETKEKERNMNISHHTVESQSLSSSASILMELQRSGKYTEKENIIENEEDLGKNDICINDGDNDRGKATTNSHSHFNRLSVLPAIDCYHNPLIDEQKNYNFRRLRLNFDLYERKKEYKAACIIQRHWLKHSYYRKEYAIIVIEDVMSSIYRLKKFKAIRERLLLIHHWRIVQANLYQSCVVRGCIRNLSKSFVKVVVGTALKYYAESFVKRAALQVQRHFKGHVERILHYRNVRGNNVAIDLIKQFLTNSKISRNGERLSKFSFFVENFMYGGTKKLMVRNRRKKRGRKINGRGGANLGRGNNNKVELNSNSNSSPRFVMSEGQRVALEEAEKHRKEEEERKQREANEKVIQEAIKKEIEKQIAILEEKEKQAHEEHKKEKRAFEEQQVKLQQEIDFHKTNYDIMVLKYEEIVALNADSINKLKEMENSIETLTQTIKKKDEELAKQTTMMMNMQGAVMVNKSKAQAAVREANMANQYANAIEDQPVRGGGGGGKSRKQPSRSPPHSRSPSRGLGGPTADNFTLYEEGEEEEREEPVFTRERMEALSQPKMTGRVWRRKSMYNYTDILRRGSIPVDIMHVENIELDRGVANREEVIRLRKQVYKELLAKKFKAESEKEKQEKAKLSASGKIRESMSPEKRKRIENLYKERQENFKAEEEARKRLCEKRRQEKKAEEEAKKIAEEREMKEKKIAKQKEAEEKARTREIRRRQLYDEFQEYLAKEEETRHRIVEERWALKQQQQLERVLSGGGIASDGRTHKEVQEANAKRLEALEAFERKRNEEKQVWLQRFMKKQEKLRILEAQKQKEEEAKKKQKEEEKTKRELDYAVKWNSMVKRIKLKQEIQQKERNHMKMELILMRKEDLLAKSIRGYEQTKYRVKAQQKISPNTNCYSPSFHKNTSIMHRNFDLDLLGYNFYEENETKEIEERLMIASPFELDKEGHEQQQIPPRVAFGRTTPTSSPSPKKYKKQNRKQEYHEEDSGMHRSSCGAPTRKQKRKSPSKEGCPMQTKKNDKGVSKLSSNYTKNTNPSFPTHQSADTTKIFSYILQDGSFSNHHVGTPLRGYEILPSSSGMKQMKQKVNSSPSPPRQKQQKHPKQQKKQIQQQQAKDGLDKGVIKSYFHASPVDYLEGNYNKEKGEQWLRDNCGYGTLNFATNQQILTKNQLIIERERERIADDKINEKWIKQHYGSGGLVYEEQQPQPEKEEHLVGTEKPPKSECARDRNENEEIESSKWKWKIQLVKPEAFESIFGERIKK